MFTLLIFKKLRPELWLELQDRRPLSFTLKGGNSARFNGGGDTSYPLQSQTFFDQSSNRMGKIISSTEEPFNQPPVTLLQNDFGFTVL